jgi:DNA-directed RNA polymerase sigma subunit (sigma70/sigma32)
LPSPSSRTTVTSRWAQHSPSSNDRERRIFEARRLADEPITLEELADEFGVSRERVRQIELRAFEKVQNAVKSNIASLENFTTEAAMPTRWVNQTTRFSSSNSTAV